MIRAYAQVNAAGEILARRDREEETVPPPEALAAHKPRWLPIVAEDPPPVTPGAEVREGPVEVVDLVAGVVRLAYSVRESTPEEVAELRAAKVAAIKAEATRRILALMPEHDQRNSLALGMEMVTTYGPDPAGWPAEMRARYEADLAIWTEIKAIRARSDQLEAALPEDPAELWAVDPLVGWDD